MAALRHRMRADAAVLDPAILPCPAAAPCLPAISRHAPHLALCLEADLILRRTVAEKARVSRDREQARRRQPRLGELPVCRPSHSNRRPLLASCPQTQALARALALTACPRPSTCMRAAPRERALARAPATAACILDQSIRAASFTNMSRAAPVAVSASSSASPCVLPIAPRPFLRLFIS